MNWIGNWVQRVNSIYSKCTDIVVSVVYLSRNDWIPIILNWVKTYSCFLHLWPALCGLRAVAIAKACCGQCCRLRAAAIAASSSVACALWHVLRPVAASAAACALRRLLRPVLWPARCGQCWGLLRPVLPPARCGYYQCGLCCGEALCAFEYCTQCTVLHFTMTIEWGPIKFKPYCCIRLQWWQVIGSDNQWNKVTPSDCSVKNSE